MATSASAAQLQAIATIQAQLASINSRLASGVRDIRDNNRSTTFDLAVLQNERIRLEAQLTQMLGIAPTTVRRLLTYSTGKGL